MHSWLHCVPRLKSVLLERAALYFLLTLCFFQPTFAGANGLGILSSEIVKSEARWRFLDHETLEKHEWVQRRALTEEGALQIGRLNLSYNKDFEEYRLLEAYTLKADGRKLDVRPQDIHVQRGLAAGTTEVTVPNAETHQITYPDVLKGDSVVWHYRTKVTRAAVPGWAVATQFLSTVESVLSSLIRIEAPTSVNLQVVAKGYTSQKSQTDGLDVWLLEGTSKARQTDQGTVNWQQWLPHVYATTLPSHETWAQRLAEPFRTKSKTTPAIRELAQQITGNLQTDREKARAIHDWIRTTIRYSAVNIGTGGFVPNDLEDILIKRYGDCKDQTLLMIALLKAVGLEAAPAFLDTSPEYVLPDLPIGMNHVIVHIPQLDVYADPTANNIPFGALPWGDADKPALVARENGTRIARTPAFGPDDNHLSVKSKWKVAADGTASAAVEFEGQGGAGTSIKDYLQRIPAGMENDVAQRILENNRLTGRGSLTYPEVQRKDQTQTMRLELEHLSNFLSDPEAGVLAPHPYVIQSLSILDGVAIYTTEVRSQPMICTPGRFREDFEVILDPAFKILRVPNDLRLEHPDGIVFEARYKLNGNHLTGWREIVQSHGRHVCDPDQYLQRREVMQRIAKHLRSGLLYMQ